MPDATSVTTLVTYYPKAGRDDELIALIQKHWPTLNQLGLVTPRPAKLWRGADKRTGRTFIVELFEWRDGASSEIAHQTPEVMAVWEPMGPLLDEMSIARLQPIDAAQHG
jgi:hypothetical protein